MSANIWLVGACAAGIVALPSAGAHSVQLVGFVTHGCGSGDHDPGSGACTRGEGDVARSSREYGDSQSLANRSCPSSPQCGADRRNADDAYRQQQRAAYAQQQLKYNQAQEAKRQQTNAEQQKQAAPHH